VLLLLTIYVSMAALGAVAVTVTKKPIEVWAIRAGVFLCLLGALAVAFSAVSPARSIIDAVILANIGVVIIALTAGTRNHQTLRTGWRRAKAALRSGGRRR
jgi:hypothetical protein